MPINTHQRIADLIDDNYAFAAVLYYFGIGFYDYDQQTLEQACAERGLKVQQVIDSLESVYEQSPEQSLSLGAYPVELIIAYLKHTHFFFVKERLPYLSKLIHDLPGTDHGDVVEDLRFVFPLFVEDLIHHIYQEEDELFSYILLLNKAPAEPQLARAIVLRYGKILYPGLCNAPRCRR